MAGLSSALERDKSFQGASELCEMRQIFHPGRANHHRRRKKYVFAAAPVNAPMVFMPRSNARFSICRKKRPKSSSKCNATVSHRPAD
ncbi:hypothetical protein [Caballeronia ptereochthonis]|uniref:hypothetical protein n=1 Tax=Caballeronia ptereochthonis TaxID=1777144 RepID=UPI00118143A7|nr:hypothetical protein [Caballeronia ptereochthonis]